jgi:hypothetical protein
MGVRTRGLDIKAGAIRNAADKAARAEAEAVIQRWNDQLALGRDMLWSPAIRAALLAAPLCSTSFVPAAVPAGRSTSGPSIAIRSPPLGTLVLGLRLLMVSGVGAYAEADRGCKRRDCFGRARWIARRHTVRVRDRLAPQAAAR